MAKPLSNILALIRGGVFDNHAGEELRDLVQRCQESGKSGTITVTISLSPKGRDNREMEVTPKLSVKKPPAAFTQEAGTFFAQRGELLRDDPDQEKLPLEQAREDREARGSTVRATGTLGRQGFTDAN